MNRAAFLLFPAVSTLSLLAKHATLDSQTGNSLSKSPADRNSIEKGGAWKMRAIASPAGLRSTITAGPSRNRKSHPARGFLGLCSSDQGRSPELAN